MGRKKGFCGSERGHNKGEETMTEFENETAEEMKERIEERNQRMLQDRQQGQLGMFDIFSQEDNYV